MLYTQISEGILKDMKKKKIENVGEYLQQNVLSENAAKLYAPNLDFTINSAISQRKMIDLGKVVARVITVNDLLELSNAGFNQKLVDNSVEMTRQEIVTLLASMNHHQDLKPLDDYSENSNWISLV